MKKRNRLRRGGRYLGVLLACLLFLQPAAAYAADGGGQNPESQVTMTLKTRVPESYMVEISADGGRIVCGGEICTDSIRLERHQEHVYWILPDPGKRLAALYYNGENVTAQVKDGVFTAPELCADAELIAEFTAVPGSGSHQEYQVEGALTDSEGNPLGDVTVEIGGITGETDPAGRFELSGLPEGEHTVVMTDDENHVIGHGTLEIRPGEDQETIDLEMQLGEDGLISIRQTEGSDAAPGTDTDDTAGDTSGSTADDPADGLPGKEEGGVPEDTAENAAGAKTGDQENVFFWGLLCAAALAAGTAGWAYRKKHS